MKSVVYTGLCKSVTVRGKKFTETVRVHVVDDTEALYFRPPDFVVNDVEFDPRKEAFQKLHEVIRHAESLDSTDYTTEGWENVQPSIDSANLVMENEDAAIEDITDAISSLQNTINELEENSAYVEPLEEGVDYNEYSAKELKELCTERGIAFANSTSKTKLIQLLNDYDQEQLDAGESEGAENKGE